MDGRTDGSCVQVSGHAAGQGSEHAPVRASLPAVRCRSIRDSDETGFRGPDRPQEEGGIGVMGAALLVVALRGAREQACDIIWRARVCMSSQFSLNAIGCAPSLPFPNQSGYREYRGVVDGAEGRRRSSSRAFSLRAAPCDRRRGRTQGARVSLCTTDGEKHA